MTDILPDTTPHIRIGDTGREMSLKELGDIVTGKGLGKTWKQIKLSVLTGRWINKETVQKLLGKLNLDQLTKIQKEWEQSEFGVGEREVGLLADIEIEKRRRLGTAETKQAEAQGSSGLVIQPRRFSPLGRLSKTLWGDLGGGEKWEDVRKQMGEATLVRLLYAYSQGEDQGNKALNEYLKNGTIPPSPEFRAFECRMVLPGSKVKAMLSKAKENFALAHDKRLGVKTKEERVQLCEKSIQEQVEKLKRWNLLGITERTQKQDDEYKAIPNQRTKLIQKIDELKQEKTEILQQRVSGFSLSDYCRGIVDARKMVENPSQIGTTEEENRDVNFFARSVVGQFISGVEEKSLQREVAVRKTEKLDDYEKDLDQKKTDETPYGEESLTKDQMKQQQAIWRKLTAPRASLTGVKDAAKDSAVFRTTKYKKYDFNNIAKGTVHEEISLNGERGEFKGTVAHCIGKRDAQEDAHATGTVTYNGKKVPFFAICDGHGGAATARFVATHLQQIIQETISGPGDLAARLPLLGVKAEEVIGVAREEGKKKRPEAQKTLSDAVGAFKGKKVPFSEKQLRGIAQNFNRSLSEPLVEKELDDLLKALDIACEKQLLGIQGIDLSKNMAPPKSLEERKTRILMMNNLLTNLRAYPDLAEAIKLAGPSLMGFENQQDIVLIYNKLLQSSPPLPNELVQQATAFFNSIPDSLVLEQSGTTLTLALPIDDELWAVNVGDSRTMLQDEKGNITQLTRDESPLVGRASVERRGGQVDVGKSGPRIYSETEKISMARSIGDRRFYGITPRAKVTRCKISPQGGRLILGCDGLYERMSTHEVGQLVQHEGFKNPEEKAQALVYGSFAMGSGDNISAMVVDIPAKKSAVEPSKISKEEIEARKQKYTSTVHFSVFLTAKYSDAFTEKYPELKNLRGTAQERNTIRFPVEDKLLEEVSHSDNPEALLSKYFGDSWKVWQ